MLATNLIIQLFTKCNINNFRISHPPRVPRRTNILVEAPNLQGLSGGLSIAICDTERFRVGAGQNGKLWRRNAGETIPRKNNVINTIRVASSLIQGAQIFSSSFVNWLAKLIIVYVFLFLTDLCSDE